VIRRRRTFRKQALPSQEEVLLDYVKRLRNHKSGRRAVHLYLSNLSRASQHPQDINVAAAHFNPLVKKYDGQLFRLANLDIVFVGKGVSLTELDDVVLKLRYMFRDDSKLKDLEQTTDADPLCTHYDVERDYDRLLADVTDLLDSAKNREAPDSSVIPFADAKLAKGEKPGDQEQNGNNIPALLRHARRNAVHAWSKNSEPTEILSEVSFDIDALKNAAGAKKDSGKDLWLLRKLTSDLDEPMVKQLLSSDNATPTTMTLPITPVTVISPDFDKFNAHYRSLARTPVVFEFSWMTVLRDVHMFLNARDKVLQAGHKISIEGWDPYAFACINPGRLEAHFLKVAWRETLAFEFKREWSGPLGETVRAGGLTKVILTECHGNTSAEFGHKHGFLLYQGEYPARHGAKAPTDQ
jgi:hypothetical protein